MTELDQEIADAMGDEDTEPERDTLEHPEGEPVNETGEQADAVQSAPRSQKEIDDLNAKLLKEAERHEKRVAEIMGEDFALLVRSPVDWTPGFIFNVPPMHPTPEDVAALMAILGQGQRMEYAEAPDAEPCPTCHALGQVLTGSRVPGQETKPCGGCNGTGWKVKLAMPAQPQPGGGLSVVPPGEPVPPNTMQVADRWGRPVGHPHYGLEPAFVGA